MITGELVPEAAFLRMTWEYEPDYVDGRIIERAWPDYPHGRTQTALMRACCRIETHHRLHALPSLRIHVRPGSYRTADFVIYGDPEPAEDYPSNTPMAVFEILVPEDPFSKIMARLADFESMGTPRIWLLDPRRSRLWQYSRGSLLNADACVLPEIGEEITRQEIFAEC